MFRELNDPIDPDRPEPTEPPVLCECGCVESIPDGDDASPVPGKVVNVTSVHWVLNG